MGIFSDAIAGISQAITDPIKMAYSIYQDQRDYNYKSDLQDKIFEREDNAVQRRVEDLKKAGLNENLAAGSAAGAGAVVSGSSKSIEGGFGNWLDTKAAVEQLKQQREMTKQAEQETKNKEVTFNMLNKQLDILNSESLMKGLDYDMAADRMNFLGNNGARVLDENGNSVFLSADDPDLPMYYKMILNDFNNSQNNASILQKQNSFYDTNAVGGLILKALGAIF